MKMYSKEKYFYEETIMKMILQKGELYCLNSYKK